MSPSFSQDSQTPDRPRIAITVGDVSGVGPELAIQCAAMPSVTARCTPILVGPANAIAMIADHVGLALVAEIVDVGSLDPAKIRPGRFNADTGKASFSAVTRAIDDALSGRIDAIVTGPIQKDAWNSGGISYPGHTDHSADRTGTTECSMMLTSDEISCVLATVHIPLADVAGMLTTESVSRAIRQGADAIGRRLGRPARVTVCGLNPHAGEGGVISHGEETTIIAPAILAAQQRGVEVIGPLPPDTAFTPAQRKKTDVYVCMYHDQGLIPLKALAFDDAVNVTLGLPIVRTSVDHGTALDLAWQGVASHHSMLAAIEMAIELC